jgi:hypothetical protein
VTTRKWSQLASADNRFSGGCLEYHRIQDAMFLFGGITGSNNIWKYSIQYNNWTQEVAVGDLTMTVRQGMACAINVPEDIFYVQGGTGATSMDLWQFDFTSKQWSIACPGNGFQPVTLNGHSLVYVESTNCIFTMFGRYTTEYNAVYIYCFDNPTLNFTLVKMGTIAPRPRVSSGKGYNPQTGEYFFFGGWAGFLYSKSQPLMICVIFVRLFAD